MCLWVLIGHTCKQTGLAIPVFRSPHYAVDGFMILSGFLMTYHALLRSHREPWTQSGTWIKFYIRRYFRISPLYYLLLVPTYLLADLFLRWRTTTDKLLGLPRPVETIQHIDPQNLVVHLTYVFGLLPKYHASTVLPDWSLSLEMQFYLCFPLFILLVQRFGWLPFSLGASSVWVLSNLCARHLLKSFTQPSPLPLSLLWFVIGMLWASAYLDSVPNARPRKIVLAAGLSLISGDPHDIALVAVFGWVLFSSGEFGLGSSASLFRRMLSGGLSSYLARASYSVYLTHLLILTPIAYFICTRFQMSARSRFLLALAATLSASYGLAKPLEVFENWGIAQGKALSGRLGRLHAPRIREVAPLELSTEPEGY